MKQYSSLFQCFSSYKCGFQGKESCRLINNNVKWIPKHCIFPCWNIHWPRLSVCFVWSYDIESPRILKLQKFHVKFIYHTVSYPHLILCFFFKFYQKFYLRFFLCWTISTLIQSHLLNLKIMSTNHFLLRNHGQL